MSLYTKSGDTGTTQLYGGGRTSKSAPRIHAVGTVDELSALIGVIIAEAGDETTFQGETPYMASLRKIQRTLYIVGADLSGSMTRVTPESIAEIERWIDEAEHKVPRLRHFILPGGTRVGALLHLARTVCRRAERWAFAAADVEEACSESLDSPLDCARGSLGINSSRRVNPECLKYLNRLGDFLFAVARAVNREGGAEETAAGATRGAPTHNRGLLLYFIHAPPRPHRRSGARAH